MTQPLIYGSLLFDPTFLFAISPNLGKIKFSRFERALLSYFTQYPNQLITRDRLLTCLEDLGSDSLDRNIDYYVSRLRRKLNDSAKSPAFIATQYGEGYIWIAALTENPVSVPEIYLTLGPIYGRVLAPEKTDLLLQQLQHTLEQCLGPQHMVSRYEELENDEDITSRYLIEISILNLYESLSFSLILLDRKNSQIIFSTRHPLSAQLDYPALAQEIKSCLVNRQILSAADPSSHNEDPLSVSMYKMSKLFGKEAVDFKEVEQQLRQKLAQDRNDYHAAMMLIVNLYTQLHLAGNQQNPNWEQEVETLLFDHLGQIQNDALYLSAAAERLYGLNYHRLAEEMANRALTLGPGFAACYMVMGKIHMFNGQFDEAFTYFDQCLAMLDKDSLFHIMVLTLKSMGWIAMGKREQMTDSMLYVIHKEPDMARRLPMYLACFVDNPKIFTADIKTILRDLPPEAGQNMLKFIYNVIARPFRNLTHRQAIILPALNFYIDLYGIDFIPKEIWVGIPELSLEKSAS